MESISPLGFDQNPALELSTICQSRVKVPYKIQIHTETLLHIVHFVKYI